MTMKFRPLYTESEISDVLDRLAGEINAFYGGKEIVAVIVLKGAFLFAADLLRRLNLPVQVEFVSLSSYFGTETTGTVSLDAGLAGDLKGKEVLVIEDIVDTGLSLRFLLDLLAGKAPRSVRVCALINKHERRRVNIEPEHVGFTCQGGFVVGYGMDYNERYRELPAVYEMAGDPVAEG